MFALDTNILVYAHNSASEHNTSAASFLERVMNDRDENGLLQVCIPAQVLIEFIHVITWQRLAHPLTLNEAIKIVDDYLATGITIVHQRPTQLSTFLSLARKATTRRKLFDLALAATLKDNNVAGIYTANVADFRFDFLEAVNPLV